MKSNASENRTERRQWQVGQSSMEYVVVCAAIAMALGVGMHDDQSVLKILLEAFRTGYERISYALSLPI